MPEKTRKKHTCPAARVQHTENRKLKLRFFAIPAILLQGFFLFPIAKQR